MEASFTVTKEGRITAVTASATDAPESPQKAGLAAEGGQNATRDAGQGPPGERHPRSSVQ